MATPIHHSDDAPLSEQIRTLFYGDQRVTPNELQVLHTRTFQRLYDLRQLGWTDRVYPDAVHTRFNHSLGTLEQADRIARWIITNCLANDKANLAKRVEDDRWVIRLVALLHDVFHIPYGHTLEDELGVLPRHDEDDARKKLLLDRVLAEAIYWSYSASYSGAVPPDQEASFWTAHDTGTGLVDVVEPFFKALLSCGDSGFQTPGGIEQFVRHYAKAAEALLYMGEYKLFERSGQKYVWPNDPPLGNVLLGHDATPLFDPSRDFYLCDIVGNTICADLLDYGRRDLHCAGLKTQYDDRLLQHFTLAEVEEDVEVVRQENGASEHIKVKETRVRTAIDLVRHRIRYDALSEILQILKIRYVLTERVLYHRTKCAAGAMLGKAVSLLSLSHDERLNMRRLGDAEFMQWLEATAVDRASSKPIDPQAPAALSIIRALRARRFYKPVYHVRSYATLRPTDKGHPATVLAEAAFRTKLEQRIEKRLGLPPGSVIIYCPRKTQLKEAKCLVIYDKGEKVQPLSKVDEDGPIGFFVKEAKAIEHEYDYLWNMYVFVPHRIVPCWPLVQRCLEEEYREMLPGVKSEELEALANDRFLVAYLKERSKEAGLEGVDRHVEFVAKSLGSNRACELLRETEEEMLVLQTRERHGKKAGEMPLLPATSRLSRW